MYVRAQRFFAVAFRMGGKVKGRAVALQNPKNGLKTALFMVFYNFYRFFYRFYKFFIDFIDFLYVYKFFYRIYKFFIRTSSSLHHKINENTRKNGQNRSYASDTVKRC